MAQATREGDFIWSEPLSVSIPIHATQLIFVCSEHHGFTQKMRTTLSFHGQAPHVRRFIMRPGQHPISRERLGPLNAVSSSGLSLNPVRPTLTFEFKFWSPTSARGIPDPGPPIVRIALKGAMRIGSGDLLWTDPWIEVLPQSDAQGRPLPRQGLLRLTVDATLEG
ncbi:uncharacterized protein L3040_008407 [Drepanopeziza brunnea f. sp. 'multigermtubi']|uniref:Uncharacterized protein n=1 Tax=Marssonina brunnea f. sp. multigermtubi (strain MB_m1) TaxID=1072389 RepID=K1WIA9_MARBU|nr:uncharacterized protein MBM_04231 [Drepanopeziza brunnea f. sp. 'multigermtubi' MB_m1]EKD17370.1 hypothetical protein MBM_04231 [Drepanopeziza brunnea f. sp. 'multigermtubi' MB_m1]KAJ5035149.1 hypothetical protein L3040_008407 [Drepanopeziza brunnea f. sp. 'multigermtubi']